VSITALAAVAPVIRPAPWSGLAAQDGPWKRRIRSWTASARCGNRASTEAGNDHLDRHGPDRWRGNSRLPRAVPWTRRAAEGGTGSPPRTRPQGTCRWGGGGWRPRRPATPLCSHDLRHTYGSGTGKRLLRRTVPTQEWKHLQDLIPNGMRPIDWHPYAVISISAGRRSICAWEDLNSGLILISKCREPLC
jgi:hypothetical protein